MTRITEVVVERRQLATAALRTRNLPAPEALAEGQALLAVGEFALTANNVTYAALGDALRYWEFFPAGEGLGIVPVWGFAEVLASRCPGVEPGERFYGYYPMASHLLVAPAQVRGSGFVDASEHRRNLPSVYNQYLRCSSDPLYRASDEALQMLLRPLFTTSFLLDDFLAEHAFFGATDLLLSSASSKTAIGLAFLLQRNRAQRGQDYRIVGLTSAGNRAFVEGLGCYDEVLAYDRLDALDASGDALSVDFAGNGALLGQLHQRLGDRLRYSCLVGAAHWDQRGGAAGSDAEAVLRPGAGGKTPQGLGRRGVPGAPGGSLGRVLGLRRRLDPGPPRCRRQRGAGGLPGPAGRALGTATGLHPFPRRRLRPPFYSAGRRWRTRRERRSGFHPWRRRRPCAVASRGDGEIPSMNRAKLYLCCVALLLVPAIAGAATADYVYGMPLDVARVLSVDEAPSDTCQVVRATLVYLDSHGERQVLHYLKQARACSNE
ncbi:DUF2855 family protein [Pseudomonas aeruginosa]|uniref:DUF2855 family protein n=1 Tax=Pseudomonas aeruginosa TaxID=287 RepID=UPI00405758FA